MGYGVWGFQFEVFVFFRGTAEHLNQNNYPMTTPPRSGGVDGVSTAKSKKERPFHSFSSYFFDFFDFAVKNFVCQV
jgi:hypothetical protein